MNAHIDTDTDTAIEAALAQLVREGLFEVRIRLEDGELEYRRRTEAEYRQHLAPDRLLVRRPIQPRDTEQGARHDHQLHRIRRDPRGDNQDHRAPRLDRDGKSRG